MVRTTPTGVRRPSPRELAAATPATRNRYADFLRVVSIVVVVIGHWLMAVLGWEDGSFKGQNLLELATWSHILTWVFQVMPIFFIVGGFTNAGSWESAARRGIGYADWLRTRAARLLRPALVFVAFWTVLPMLAVAVVLPSGVARTGGREVALPIWFLAVYLLTVAAAPPLLAAHRRFGVRLIVFLGAGAVVVDAVRYGFDLGWVGALNHLFVWLAILELGFLWRDGVLTHRRLVPWAMAIGGLAVLSVLTTVGSEFYPVSMITLAHAEHSNALPPTIAMLALSVWQCGAMLILQAPANRWLERSRVWVGVVAANGMLMTFYLWNMTAAVLAAVILLPTGLAPQPEPLTTAWWWLRLGWVAACAVCLMPFLFAFRWAERPGAPARPAHAGWLGIATALAGSILASAGMAIIATAAFPVQGELVAGPALGVACLAAGAVLLHVDPISPLRHGARTTDRGDPGESATGR
jgi:fucose 4-O-acetylase-like acetyltransferase